MRQTMSILFEPLDLVLSSASKVRLLRVLYGASASLSGREAATAARVAVHPAQRALADLVALGVVLREDASSQHLYRLNRDSVLVARCITPMFRGEEARVDEVFGTLRQAVAGFETGARPRMEGMYLFGSAARGTDRIGSDLDMAAIAATAAQVNKVHETLAQLAPEVYSRYGLRLSVVVLDLKKLRRMHADGDALIEELLRDNRRITGRRLEELIHGDARKQKGSRPGAR